MASDPKLRRWYRDFNVKFFNGELPDNVEVWWEPCGTASAFTYVIHDAEGGAPPELGIKFDPALHMFTKLTKLILLHEMIHVKLWPIKGLTDHGRKFDEELQRLLGYRAVRKLI